MSNKLEKFGVWEVTALELTASTSMPSQVLQSSQTAIANRSSGLHFLTRADLVHLLSQQSGICMLHAGNLLAETDLNVC